MHCKLSSLEEHHLSCLVSFVFRQNSQQDAVYSKGVTRLFALRTDPLGNLCRGSEDNEVIEVEALVMSAEDASCWQFKPLHRDGARQRNFDNFTSHLV